MASGQPDGVAHLGADEGLVAEVVVAGDELVPQPALSGAAIAADHCTVPRLP